MYGVDLVISEIQDTFFVLLLFLPWEKLLNAVWDLFIFGSEYEMTSFCCIWKASFTTISKHVWKYSMLCHMFNSFCSC